MFVSCILLLDLKTHDTDIVGKPIEVEKRENPTNEEIDLLHQKFIEGLVRLFERYKNESLENPKEALLTK